MKRTALFALVACLVLPGIAWGQCEPGWTLAEPIPSGLGQAIGGYYNGKVYAAGGYGTVDKGYDPMEHVYIYDVALDTWSSGADMPHPAKDTAGTLYNGKIYVIGGYYMDMNKHTRIYDIAEDTWDTGAYLPAGLAGSNTAAQDNTIYLIGGYDPSNLDSVLAYDIALDTWDNGLAAAPATLSYGGGASDGTYIYSVAGMVDNLISGDLHRYDPGANTWTTLTGAGTKRFWPGVGITFGQDYPAGVIYVIGGIDVSYDPISDAQLYDIAQGTWSPGFPLIHSTGAGLATHTYDYGGLLFYIGGYSNAKIPPAIDYNQIFHFCLADIELISPDSTEPGTAVDVIISGWGFETDDTAYLDDGSKLTFDLDDLSVDDSETISATVPADVPEGTYNVVVESSSGEISTLENGFTIGAGDDDDDDDDDDDGGDDDDDDDDDGGCCG